MTGDFDEGVYTLLLGVFDLSGDGPGGLWRCDALADGTDLAGNPIPVQVAIATLIQDGSVSYTEKYDNPTITIRACIKGPDAEALDAGAAALFAQVGRANVLTYQGPLAATPIAWDVVNSHLDRNSDDLAEVRAERYYTVTLSVLPFRRKTTETTTLALPTGGTTTTLVDNGSSATGWTGAVSGIATAPSSVGGAVQVTGTLYPGGLTGTTPGQGDPTMLLKRTGTINTTSTRLIVADWKATRTTAFPRPIPYQTPNVSATAGGVPLARVAQQASPTAGYTRTWFQATVNSLPDVAFTVAFEGTAIDFETTGTFSIDIVNRTDVVPTVGPGQQTIRSIGIEGSARTPGAVAIEHATAALGDVLAFFWADDGTGYTPPLSPYHSAGAGVTTDTTRVSGGRENLNATTTRYDVPANRLPRDGYQLTALLGIAAVGPAVGTVTWTATTRVNGVDLGPTVTGTMAVSVLAGYVVVPLGNVQLPTRDLDEVGTGAVVRISLTADADISVDEVWAFRDSGQLVGPVPCGSGTPSSGGPAKRVFIEPPTMARPRPVVRIGHAADRSDSFHPPGLGAWEFPEFPPPAVNVLLVTTNTTGASVSFRHYERLAG